MTPPRKDLEVWAGNTWGQSFRLKAGGGPFDLTGSRLVWRMVLGATTTRKTSDVPGSGIEITDAAEGEFTIALTVDETRTWQDGSVVRYEIERWVGADQLTLIYGQMVVTAWVNDDVDP